MRWRSGLTGSARSAGGPGGARRPRDAGRARGGRSATSTPWRRPTRTCATGEALATVRADVAVLRDAVAAYQAAGATARASRRCAAPLLGVAPRLPDELTALADVFARPARRPVPAALAGGRRPRHRVAAGAVPLGGRRRHAADRRHRGRALQPGGLRHRPARARALARGPAAQTAGARRGVVASRHGATRQRAAPRHSADVQAVMGEDFRVVGLITILGILVVLALLLRSLVAPLYLVGTRAAQLRHDAGPRHDPVPGRAGPGWRGLLHPAHRVRAAGGPRAPTTTSS